jgi:hypothetical protein
MNGGPLPPRRSDILLQKADSFSYSFESRGKLKRFFCDIRLEGFG